MDKLTIGGLLFCFAAGVSAVNIPPQKASMIDRKVFEEHYAAYREHCRKNAASRVAPAMKVRRKNGFTVVF